MRKNIVVFVILCVSLFLSWPVFSKDEKKDILLSTVDIHANYDVIGIVYGRISSNDIKELNDELIRRAGRIDADAVIGVRYLAYLDYLYAYGTAVKRKD